MVLCQNQILLKHPQNKEMNTIPTALEATAISKALGEPKSPYLIEKNPKTAPSKVRRRSVRPAD